MIRLQEAILLQDLLALECLRNNEGNEIDDEILELATFINQGDYSGGLQHKFSTPILENYNDPTQIIEAHLESYKNIELDREIFKFALVGITCLNAFMQANWTGPNFQIPNDNPLTGELSKEEIEEKLYAQGGETVFTIIKQPKLLIAALSILSYPYNASRALYSIPWWSIRCLRAQQTTVIIFF